MNDQLKERIKFDTEVLKLITQAIFIISSGVFTLMLLPIDSPKVFLIAFFGSILVILLSLVFVKVFTDIRRLIKKL